jgi:CRISPR/Cas system CSM-associated protein Csm3 (group 7 of RAMP superfamily)
MAYNSTVSDYVYVNLERPTREEVTGHDRPEGVTGIASFSMRVTSDYLFVGSGRQDYSDQYHEAYHTFFRSKGELVVPATTLKGAIRSVAEAISASCVTVRSWNDRRKLVKYSKCTVPRNAKKIRICPACRIFGTTGYKGHVSFSDALPEEGIEPKIVKIADLWRPRKHILMRKFYKTGKFMKVEDQSPVPNYRYIEAVPENSTFGFNLFFENALNSDLSLVFHSMGIDQDFEIKVGGAKPRCLGSVSFEIKKVRLIENLVGSVEKDPRSFIIQVLAEKELIKSERVRELSRTSSRTACTGG